MTESKSSLTNALPVLPVGKAIAEMYQSLDYLATAGQRVNNAAVNLRMALQAHFAALEQKENAEQPDAATETVQPNQSIAEEDLPNAGGIAPVKKHVWTRSPQEIEAEAHAEAETQAAAEAEKKPKRRTKKAAPVEEVKAEEPAPAIADPAPVVEEAKPAQPEINYNRDILPLCKELSELDVGRFVPIMKQFGVQTLRDVPSSYWGDVVAALNKQLDEARAERAASAQPF